MNTNQHECYIIMKTDYHWMGYTVQLTEQEYRSLKEEFEQYNAWYLAVLRRDAPQSSYSKESFSEDSHERTRNFNSEVDYEYILYSPHYDKWTVWDEEYTHDDGTVETVRMISYPEVYEDGSVEDYVDEYSGVIRDSTEWLKSATPIIETIVEKYNPFAEFSIGYRLLPVTAALVTDGRLKVGEGVMEYLRKKKKI